jgi:vacuolar protein sorting-associated protein 13A/C
LQKTKEASEKQQSIFTNILTRTIDNLQVNIQNMHLRLESNNVKFSSEFFSMGFTLEQLSLQTTNEDWTPKFIDRTTPQSLVAPLYKLMSIVNFGFYYKPNEESFISEIKEDQQRLSKLQQLFKFGLPQIKQYKDDYLLEPMSL